MIPFLVADRPASLRILSGLAVPALPHRIGLMTHANTSVEFADQFRLFPCGDRRYCETLHPTARHDHRRCDFGVSFSRHFIKMSDSGAFNKEGCQHSDYRSLFSKYRKLGVHYGVMIDHLKDSERTIESAAEALEQFHREKYPFHLVGVSQGNNLREYLDCYTRLRRMGYEKIAVGGLLKKKENSKHYAHVRDESLLYGVLRAIRLKYPTEWLFALGAYHPKRHNRLDALNVFGGDYKGWIFQYEYKERDRARGWLDEERYGQVRSYIEKDIVGRITGEKTNRNLLVLGCSRTKRRKPRLLPAIERYDGPTFRMVRGLYFDGLHLDVDLMVFSGRFGLIKPSALIPYYDFELRGPPAPVAARRARLKLADEIERSEYREVFLAMGNRYRAAFNGFSVPPTNCRVITSSGPIGKQLRQVRRWLLTKTNRTPPSVRPLRC